MSNDKGTILELLWNEDGSFTYNVVTTGFDTRTYAVFLATFTAIISRIMTERGGSSDVREEIARFYAEEVRNPTPPMEIRPYHLQ